MTDYILDPDTVELRFRARGLWGAMPVYGRFTAATGGMTWQDGKPGTIDVSVEADSIDTGNRLRDGHLRAERFFHTARFPLITFRGQVSSAPGGVCLRGSLTVRGHEAPYTLHVGTSRDGQTLLGTAATTVDLNSFGFAPPLRMARRDVHLSLHGSFRPR